MDRLEQVGVDPLLAEPDQVTWTVSGGQQNDARSGKLGALPDLGGQRQAVHVGHADVEKHQRIRLAAGGAVPKGVHGRHAVADCHSLHLPAAQPLLEDAAVGAVIIDDQHRQVVKQHRRSDSNLLRWLRLTTEPRREGKGATLARLACHGDLPTHQGHQPGGDGQAQPGAAVLARGGRILLLEGPEDFLLLVGWNADAGIADFESQRDEG